MKDFLFIMSVFTSVFFILLIILIESEMTEGNKVTLFGRYSLERVK